MLALTNQLVYLSGSRLLYAFICPSIVKSPLSLGEQLCRNRQSQILLTFRVLHVLGMLLCINFNHHKIYIVYGTYGDENPKRRRDDDNAEDARFLLRPTSRLVKNTRFVNRGFAVWDVHIVYDVRSIRRYPNETNTH